MGVSKRIFLIALALCLVPLGAMAGALNGDSSVFSKELALRALNWNNAQTADDFRAIFEAEGFEVIAQNNFDKAADDPAHTCAWTAARGMLDTGDGQRAALVIAIRGTTAGEWYSNVDIAPSQQDGGVFAENFLFAAQDVFVNLQPILEQLDADTAIVVTGHSRGGACANLLGMLLNEEIGMERVYVYTSAAPATVKYTWSVNYNNIFNLINAGDIVPRVPLAACGGRVLAADVCAAEDVPSFDRSAFDGYAFRSADAVAASETNPVTLRIVEEIRAGDTPSCSVTAGTAAKILTGEADIAEMPIEYAPQFTKKYNETICTDLGLTVPEGYEAIA